MMNTKIAKILLGLFLALLVSVSAVAYAEDDNGDINARGHMEKKMDRTMDQMEKKLETFENRIENAWGLNDGNNRAVTMQHDGTYRVSGVEAKAINTSSQMLTVELFGFTREVSVAGARLIGGGKAITLADFQVGDKLTGRGMFDPATRAIKVQEVHNLSYRNRASSDIQARIQALLEMIRKLQEQIKTLR